MNKPTWLLDHARNVFSQAGEDGVLLAALELLPNRDCWCVEFGAWDGIHLSNTANLIKNEGYSAVLIEGDTAKVKELKKNFAGVPGITPVHGFVGYGDEDNLDSILRTTPIPRDFDFLSIDIDGNDYHVWEAVKEYRPKLVCIEFNPTIPTEVAFVQEKKANVNQGSSVAALAELGKQKGYELVCVLSYNGVFVRNDLFSLFGIADNRPCALRTDNSAVTYLFSGYDGKVFLRGARRLPWHEMTLDELRFQALPTWARIYPPNYPPLRARLFNLLKRGGLLR